jgi:predicted TIM-barrel fold metal-dependent hydrolase
MRIVGIEEHVMRPGSEKSATHLTEAARAKLHPSVEQRIADMDAAGISVEVLSLPVASPGLDWSAANPLAEVMPLDESALPIAQGVNEELYQMVSKHPDRFSAFATLPAGAPKLAAAELERAVKELGFVGAYIWGTIGDQFLDEPRFAPILETAARLDVPIYLHPGPPPKRIDDVYYTGDFNPAVSAALSTVGYGWHYEVSLHVIRLIVGLCDRAAGHGDGVGRPPDLLPAPLGRIHAGSPVHGRDHGPGLRRMGPPHVRHRPAQPGAGLF